MVTAPGYPKILLKIGKRHMELFDLKGKKAMVTGSTVSCLPDTVPGVVLKYDVPSDLHDWHFEFEYGNEKPDGSRL